MGRFLSHVNYLQVNMPRIQDAGIDRKEFTGNHPEKGNILKNNSVFEHNPCLVLLDNNLIQNSLLNSILISDQTM